MKLGVSESSVIRFSRSLGFSGFMDFQKSLRKDYQDKVLSISSTITVPAQRVVKRAKLESNSDYINRHFKNAAKNLESALVHNAPATFEEAADTIISSKRKYIVASRGNSCLGDYFLLYLKDVYKRQILICSPWNKFYFFFRHSDRHFRIPCNLSA